jgi:hypothetical protein
MRKAAESVSRCTSEEACFASEPFAYGIFLSGAGDDPLYDDLLQSSGIAAIKAAKNGEQLLSAKAKVPRLRTESATITQEGLVTNDMVVGRYDEVSILDLAAQRDSVSDMAFRIAQCAYICALRAEGLCPIFTTYKEDNDSA